MTQLPNALYPIKTTNPYRSIVIHYQSKFVNPLDKLNIWHCNGRVALPPENTVICL